MPTLYVENVPEDVYDALRARAQRNRSSISAEVIDLIKTFVPTEADLARRRAVLQLSREMRSRKPASPGPFPSAEEMIREDRSR